MESSRGTCGSHLDPQTNRRFLDSYPFIPASKFAGDPGCGRSLEVTQSFENAATLNRSNSTGAAYVASGDLMSALSLDTRKVDNQMRTEHGAKKQAFNGTGRAANSLKGNDNPMWTLCKRSMGSLNPYLARLRTGSTPRSIVSVFSGDILRTLISFIASILIARWTLPYDMGVWNAALLVTVYTPVLQGGVLNGLNRQLPYLIGTGDEAKAIKVAAAAYAWSLFLTVVSTIATVGIVFFLWYKGRGQLCYTTMAIGTNVACSWTTFYFTFTYRTHSQFGRLARNTILTAVVGVTLTALVWYFRYNGILLRASLLSLFGVAVLYFRRPIPVRPQWNGSLIVHLARVGIPIWFVGQLGDFFTSFDRLVLVRSPQLLGYFTIAIQVAAFARLIPIAFSIVLYPQMAHRYGQTHNAMAIWHIARKGAIAACSLGAVAGCCGWLLIPHIVKILLPKYLPGAASAQWASFMGLAAGIYIFDNVYNVIGRQDLYIANWLVGAVVFFGSWFSLTHGFNRIHILAAAQSMLLATLVMALVSLFVSRRACLMHDQRVNAGN